MEDVMERVQKVRSERLEARISSEQKALFQRAAALQGRTLTDFCLAALTEAARKTVAEHEQLVLSERDRAAFFDVLVNPPELNERLRRAFEGHARLVVRE